MILVALGANLPSRHGPPRATLEAAVAALETAGLRIVGRSRWYRSAPVPPSEQPDFVNGVIAVETALEPAALLALLHAVERDFGRIRGRRNAARPLDLDLIAYHDRIMTGGEGRPVLPHPRLGGRAFVLRPLAELAPGWRHPATGETVSELLARLPPDQPAEPLGGGA